MGNDHRRHEHGPDGRRRTRRRFLLGVGAAVTAALAGCTDGDEGGEDETDGSDDGVEDGSDDGMEDDSDGGMEEGSDEMDGSGETTDDGEEMQSATPGSVARSGADATSDGERARRHGGSSS